MYYSVMNNLSERFDKLARKFPMDASDKYTFMKWQEEARRKLRDIIKLDNMEKCQLEPKRIEECESGEGIVRQKILVSVEKDVYMPMYILIPDGCRNNKNARVMIAMSGHLGGGMAAVVGMRDNELVKGAIEKFNYDYGIQLAKQGIVAVCPETRGFGERREAAKQTPEAILECSCYHISHMAYSLGLTLMGMQVFDVMRVVDYVIERDEWNVNNLGILGFSGGGLQALYTAALDERIKNIIVSGYMYGYKEALFEKNGNCNCNYVDGLWQNFDMGDIGAMLAPRPVIFQSGDEDHLNGKSGLSNVYSQIDIVREAYRVLDKEKRVWHDVCNGPHKWYSDNLPEYLDFFEKT